VTIDIQKSCDANTLVNAAIEIYVKICILLFPVGRLPSFQI